MIAGLCTAKNAIAGWYFNAFYWHRNKTCLSLSGQTLDYAGFMAVVARTRLALRKNGCCDGPILLWPDDALASLIGYAVSDIYGYTAVVPSAQMSDSDMVSCLDRWKCGAVIVGQDGLARARNFVSSASRPLPVVEVTAPTDSTLVPDDWSMDDDVGRRPEPGLVVISQTSAGVSETVLGQEQLAACVRSVCAEIPLNHHDRCAILVPVDTLWGRIATLAAIYRCAGMYICSPYPGTFSIEAPTVAFLTDEDCHSRSAFPHSNRPMKAVWFVGDLAEYEQVVALRGREAASRVLCSIGGAVPTFCIIDRPARSCVAEGSEGPAGVIGRPLLGVDFRIGEEDRIARTGDTGPLFIRSSFVPESLARPTDPTSSRGALVAQGSHGLAGRPRTQWVNTGVKATLVAPGRLCLVSAQR